MLGLNFVIYYFIRSWREKKRRERKLRLARQRRNAKGIKLKTVGSNRDPEDVVDGNLSDTDEDILVTKRSFASKVVMIWGVVEVLSLLSILCFTKARTAKVENSMNFLSHLCVNRMEMCADLVTRIIYYKLLLAVCLVIGAKYRILTLMAPWFIVNVLGIFPYCLVTISFFYSFQELKTKWAVLSHLLGWFA